MEIKTSYDLNSQIYQDALQIRKEVFVEEQGVDMALEIEGEQGPRHYTGYVNGQAVVTARAKVEADGAWHLQRVATKKAYRGQGLAKKLLLAIETDARASQVPYLTLGAQDQAQEFYLKLGYHVVGEGFLDADIPHHRMDKDLQLG